MKIFVVEDDAVISGAICRHLESWGCECRCGGGFPRRPAGVRRLRPAARADGHLAALLQRLPLVPGDPQALEGAHHLSVLRADNMNIVMAVNMGGDDFWPSPSIWTC
jgi:CheY-like chemotaxis protein